MLKDSSRGTLVNVEQGLSDNWRAHFTWAYLPHARVSQPDQGQWRQRQLKVFGGFFVLEEIVEKHGSTCCGTGMKLALVTNFATNNHTSTLCHTHAVSAAGGHVPPYLLEGRAHQPVGLFIHAASQVRPTPSMHWRTVCAGISKRDTWQQISLSNGCSISLITSQKILINHFNHGPTWNTLQQAHHRHEQRKSRWNSFTPPSHTTHMLQLPDIKVSSAL